MFHNLAGVKIYVYTNDHNPPHFYAMYAEPEALIVIQTLEIYAGSLPANKLKAARKWAAVCQADLLAEFVALNPGLWGVGAQLRKLEGYSSPSRVVKIVLLF